MYEHAKNGEKMKRKRTTPLVTMMKMRCSMQSSIPYSIPAQQKVSIMIKKWPVSIFDLFDIIQKYTLY